MLTWPTSRRAAQVHDRRPFGEFDACIGGWEFPASPTPRPGTDFSWWRAAWWAAGRNHWGRIPCASGRTTSAQESGRPGRRLAISYEDVAPTRQIDRLDRDLRQQGEPAQRAKWGV